MAILCKSLIICTGLRVNLPGYTSSAPEGRGSSVQLQEEL